MYSYHLTTLLSSIPCCSTRPTLILPNSSSGAVISLIDLLKYGKSNYISTDLIGLKKEVLETAKVLEITVAALEHWEETAVENNEDLRK